MKILIVRNFPSFFSVKKNTYNIQEIGLAKALIRKGNFCDIVFWTKGKEEAIKYSFDENLSLNIFYRKGKTVLKNTVFNIDDLAVNYDVIQTCEYNQFQSWQFAKKYASKLIIYHGPYFSEFNKNYNKMCKVFDLLFLSRYKKLNTPFIVKSKLAEEFLKNKGLNNLNNIGVGIDLQVLSNGEEQCREPIIDSIKKYSGIKLLYIGKLEERRNIEFLFRVLAEVNKTKEAKLFLVGNGESEYINSAFQLAESLGVNDKIVWQKKMEQKYMSSVYGFADYFLLPTYYEIFGMVLLEAMYFKKVVLTTNNGGSSTLIKDKENGYVLPQNDTRIWVNTILQNEKDKDAKEKIGVNASYTISQKFTWDTLADQFLNAYKGVGRKYENINDK